MAETADALKSLHRKTSRRCNANAARNVGFLKQEARPVGDEAGFLPICSGIAVDQHPSSAVGAVCRSATALFIAPTVPGEAGC